MESGSPPRCVSVRLHVGNSGVPTTAGDSDDKAKQTYSRGTAAKRNRVMERSWAYTCKHTLPSLPFSQDQFPPLILRLSLCGLTGRSSPVNLSYPLFRLCLPPASHIFSTWQSLNLSADGAHYYFLWLVKRGEWDRSPFCALSDGQMWQERALT